MAHYLGSIQLRVDHGRFSDNRRARLTIDHAGQGLAILTLTQPPAGDQDAPTVTTLAICEALPQLVEALSAVLAGTLDDQQPATQLRLAVA